MKYLNVMYIVYIMPLINGNYMTKVEYRVYYKL